jgi:MraZ protein
MSHFMGQHHAKLDSKGRVFIPAPIRGVLREALGEGEAVAIVMLPSYKQPCVQVWPARSFYKLGAAMDQLPVFSEEQDDLAFSLFADATEITPDKDGRIVLPEQVAQHAGVTDELVFVGLRDRFEIWNPQSVARRRAEAHERARSRGLTLPGPTLPGMTLPGMGA